jgi:hypothetical protein
MEFIEKEINERLNQELENNGSLEVTENQEPKVEGLYSLSRKEIVYEGPKYGAWRDYMSKLNTEKERLDLKFFRLKDGPGFPEGPEHDLLVEEIRKALESGIKKYGLGPVMLELRNKGDLEKYSVYGGTYLDPFFKAFDYRDYFIRSQTGVRRFKQIKDLSSEEAVKKYVDRLKGIPISKRDVTSIKRIINSSGFWVPGSKNFGELGRVY